MNHLVGKKVLLVDDETPVRQAIAMLIGFLGADITEAGDGVEALARFGEGAFDLVITDHTMPGMTGALLAEAIHKARPEQRIIMISGYAEQLRREGALPSSIGALLPKPCPLMELTEALERLGFFPQPRA